jgi:dipeptidyl aminopeptidase/acylaminoacyl peptidase
MYVNETVKIPPVLLFHSENDPIVSVENSRFLYKKLINARHEAYYYEIEGSEAHGGSTFFDSKILDIIQDFCNKHM